MPKSKYSIRYLPKFENDLNEIVDYIAFNLKNPNSANKLIDKIEAAIQERANFPVSFEPYQSSRRRKKPYYRIYVDNFTIYYVVIDDVMEIRRVLYKGRDSGKLINPTFD